MGKKDKDNIKKPMENQEPELQDTKDTQEQEPLAENDQTVQPSETEEFNEQIDKLNQELDSAKDSYLRLFAEYDNFKRRTAREKEALLFEATATCVGKILPVLDNLMRAVATECSDTAYKSGIDMLLKSFLEAFDKMGVKRIEAKDQPFDPQLHNAVMHVEGDEYPQNTVIEVFQEGYIMGDRVIRHSMVKVAN